jgi:hypothetical protein
MYLCTSLICKIIYIHFSLKNLIFIDYKWDLTSCYSCNCNLISHSVRFYPNLKICSSRKALKIFFWLIFTSAHKTSTMKCGSNFFPEMWFLNLLVVSLEVSTAETNRDWDLSTCPFSECRDFLTCQYVLFKLSRFRVMIKTLKKIETYQDLRA